MAYTDRPDFRGDLFLCDSRSVAFFSRPGLRTKQEMNLQGGAQNRVLRAV